MVSERAGRRLATTFKAIPVRSCYPDAFLDAALSRARRKRGFSHEEIEAITCLAAKGAIRTDARPDRRRNGAPDTLRREILGALLSGERSQSGDIAGWMISRKRRYAISTF